MIHIPGMNGIRDSGGKTITCVSPKQACKDKAPVECGTEATHCYISLTFDTSLQHTKCHFMTCISLHCSHDVTLTAACVEMNQLPVFARNFLPFPNVHYEHYRSGVTGRILNSSALTQIIIDSCLLIPERGFPLGP